MSESVGDVGVVGDEDDTIADCLRDADCAVRSLTPTTATDATADAVVVAGQQSLLDLVAAGLPDAPVLPVDAGDGVRSVPPERTDAALSQLLAGEATGVSYPVLEVRADGDHETRVLFDCMLVTAEPARISEYAVASGESAVDQFRADGVVVATPAGTHGYARRVDAPVIDPRADVLSVAPVAPFATHSDHWVFPSDRVRLTVERDDEPVELLADDRTVGPIAPGTPVEVSRSGSLSVLTLPASRPPFPECHH
jgi:NAD+ kinase